ncbi:MAG: type II secretion system protein F, partial [Lachnospiraceae bacterium]|nr:type II secretion system protein F [Lachnospiraceae bacterium]
MKKKLLINIPIETVFEDFSSRTGIDEIIAFSEVIKISKKGGGDMIAIIKSTITTIRAKIELTEDISATVSSKKYEQLVMMVMPFAIFAYIDITRSEFFSPLYHNLLGIIISSIC